MSRNDDDNVGAMALGAVVWHTTMRDSIRCLVQLRRLVRSEVSDHLDSPDDDDPEARLRAELNCLGLATEDWCEAMAMYLVRQREAMEAKGQKWQAATWLRELLDEQDNESMEEAIRQFVGSMTARRQR